MLIQIGDSRSLAVDLRLALTLSAVAGAINAAGFYAVGFFSANMTGNVSTLSDALAFGRWELAALLIAVLLAFIAGAFCSAVLVAAGRNRQIKAIYAYSILLEAGLLAALALADLLLPQVHSGAMLVLGLSFLMGLQNAATTMISAGRVRTTHVSGMATDVGIELAGLLGGAEPRRSFGRLLLLHGTTLLAFLLGGVVGFMTYPLIGSVLLLIIAAALALLAAPFIRAGRGSGEKLP